MPDFLTKAERSHRMSLIRGKFTGPEQKLALLLDENGIKYDRYRRDLPGNPDFVAGRVVIFVNGVFWHGRHFDSWRHKLSGFWVAKITKNMQRDKRAKRALRRLGWQVVSIWETELRNPDKCLSYINRAKNRT